MDVLGAANVVVTANSSQTSVPGRMAEGAPIATWRELDDAVRSRCTVVANFRDAYVNGSGNAILLGAKRHTKVRNVLGGCGERRCRREGPIQKPRRHHTGHFLSADGCERVPPDLRSLFDKLKVIFLYGVASTHDPTLSLSKGKPAHETYPPNLLSFGKPLGAIIPAPARLPM